MWKELPEEEREKYKDYILGLTSCSKAFSQKNIEPIPIIISKYQESAFQNSFCCISEDINNTSFDTAKIVKHDDTEKKFLIGIKTFGYNNSMQKIAQFKSELNLWQPVISMMRKNAKPNMSKEDINRVNRKLYKELAIELSMKRNERIQNSMSQLRSFSISSDDTVESVYHVLMPSSKEQCIYLGEIGYDQINIENIHILGCCNKNNPMNFEFSDGLHRYKFTPCDSQLYMDFENEKIVLETWPVGYVQDPLLLFGCIGKNIRMKKDIDSILKHGFLCA